ncbi:MAG TPA: MAPEG family protein [Xanthobacteraceae bacterium]|nr:MAPEG family protein [Xanthobacteraceae bacterium]
MSYQMILAPLFVQVLLTLFVAYMLAGHRMRAALRGDVPDRVALREPNWPPHVRQVENNYLNQFELPVLFYLLTILAIITRHADLFFVLMAWVFVVLRIFHAYVHLTSNVLRVRGMLFVAGAIVLTIMWVVFIIRIMLGLP